MGGLCHFHAILEYIEPIAWQYSRELDQDDYRVKSTLSFVTNGLSRIESTDWPNRNR